MSRFLGDLDIRTADDQDDGKWVVVTALTYESDVAGRSFTVPVGFPTDLASVPRFPVVYLLCGNTSDKAACVHDYLYRYKPVSRATADAVLREASAVTGVPGWRRWLMWAGVRCFGWNAWREDSQ